MQICFNAFEKVIKTRFSAQNDMRWKVERFCRKAQTKLPDEMERHLFPNKYPDEAGYPKEGSLLKRKRKIYNFEKDGVPSEHEQPTRYHIYLNEKNEKYTTEQLAKTTFMLENKLFFDQKFNEAHKKEK